MAATDSLTVQYNPTPPMRRQCALCPGYPQGYAQQGTLISATAILRRQHTFVYTWQGDGAVEWPANIEVFEWDERKRQTNLREHGIDFVDARRVIDGPILVRRSDRQGETRFLVYGFIEALEVVVICTFRGENCRIISARRARRDERKKYHGGLPRRSEAGQD